MGLGAALEGGRSSACLPPKVLCHFLPFQIASVHLPKQTAFCLGVSVVKGGHSGANLCLTADLKLVPRRWWCHSHHKPPPVLGCPISAGRHLGAGLVVVEGVRGVLG